MSIYKKLHTIQTKVKGLSKDKQSYNFDYVTGNKLLSFIKPEMDKLCLILKQEVISIDNERQDYQTYHKPSQKWVTKSEILSKVMMKFTWVDTETGEKDENLFGANGQNDWEKGLGSALTYAERYFILKYFHIPTDEDDIDDPSRKPQEPEPTLDPEKTPEGIKLLSSKNIKELTEYWNKLTGEQKVLLNKLKDKLKLGLS